MGKKAFPTIAACLLIVVAAVSQGIAADRPGSCCSVVLDGNESLLAVDSSGEPSRLEGELLRRIEQNARRVENAKPVFYRLVGEELSLEVAGASCNEAKQYAREQLLAGAQIEMVFGESVLRLDFSAVADMRVAPNRDLMLQLTPSAREDLRRLTQEHMGEEAAIVVDDVGEVQRLRISSEIGSGVVVLDGGHLPESLSRDRRLAIPLVVGECSAHCESSYTWLERGARHVYKPE